MRTIPVKKGATVNLDDSVHEMNELIESDAELNAADFERLGNTADDEGSDDEQDGASGYGGLYNDDDGERSLVDSDEERETLRSRKDKDAKINNSFTGPYPLDPTDFNHTDKGPNYQFH